MNLTLQWMQTEWGRALGWTFIHSLWQIAVIGFLLYIILRYIPGRSAHVRYTISTMAFWMIVMTVLSTFIIMLPDSKPVTEITGQYILVKSTGSYSLIDRISIWLESRMAMMLSIWFGGVLILMTRLVFSLGWVQHMRSAAVPMELIQNTLNELIQRLELRIKPRASASGYVSSPVTIGHIKPMILFPIGIINQLTPREVEAILTHELAHIVRRDYLSNLIQSFIETLFYYHPVTWWISNMVRTERENRADDLAVSWCGDHLGYAKALITVQEMQVGASPSLTIGFASGKGAMLARIQRILHIPYKNHNQMERTVLLSLCSLFFLGFTLNSHTQEKKKETISNEKELVSLNVTVTDSIPGEGTYRIHKKTDDQDISIEVENGDIKELQIDGKKIAPSEFDQYGEIIDELFGEVEAPPSMEGFEFEMPPMPDMPPSMYSYSMSPMPPMPPMTFSYSMPPMAPMPPMPPMNEMNEMQIERLFSDCPNLHMLNNENLDLYILDQMGDLNIISDSIDPEETRIIIIRNGDSTVIINPHVVHPGDAASRERDQYLNGNMEWKEQQEYLKQLNKELKESQKDYELQWKENAEQNSQQWNNNWREQEEKMRAEQERMHAEGQRMREENIEQYRHSDYDRAMQEALEAEGHGRARVYGFYSPRRSMTDEMIAEGFVSPDEEVEVLLTPDKLKIDGKKMPDDVHQKYLRMYEDQTGVELSGNSRVEFKTKSHRSM